jgi:signal transduction histidine kinase
MVRNSLTEARRSVWDLRPQVLERGDLSSALSEIAKQMTTGTRVQAEVKVSGKPLRLSNFVETNLLRIGQESLSNALKHAQASKVVIELIFDRRRARLRVTDDGRGFEPQFPLSAESGHFGLLGIKERVEQIEGQLLIRSNPGQGTEVEVSVPVD